MNSLKDKILSTLIPAIIIIAGISVVNWAWSPRQAEISATSSAPFGGEEMGPHETLIMGATIITVGIIAGIAERIIFGDNAADNPRPEPQSDK